eukprot:9467851-Pyramimonas_sp.AAC.1
MSRQERSASRQSWRRKNRAGDDDEEWEGDARLVRRGVGSTVARPTVRVRAPAPPVLAAFGALILPAREGQRPPRGRSTDLAFPRGGG